MSAANPARLPAARVGVDYPRVSLLSLGHFINDIYGNFMVSLTPYLVIRGAISTTAAGFVLLVYLFGSSVLQPIFGLFSDRSGKRLFAICGPIWVGTAAVLFSRVSTAALLMVIACLGGVGTAAFHPQAASMVDLVSPARKGWTMSIFTMGGNLGFGCGPALAAGLALIGFRWAPLLLLPGAVLTVTLALWAPRFQRVAISTDLSGLRDAFARSRRALSCIVAVIAIRSGVLYSFIIFLPLYYHARGFAAQLGSYQAFVLAISGAVGGLIGGRMSDRFGRRIVVVTSLVMAAPLLFLTLLASGPIVWVLLAVAGGCLLASGSSTVVQGQELLPASTGIASGLTLGFAFGLSGLLTSSLTAVSDHIGVTHIIMFVPLLSLVAAGLGSIVPETRASREKAPAPAARPARHTS